MLTEEQLRKNAVYHTLDGIFFFLASMVLFSQEIIMPQMVSELSESKFLVGLIPTVFSVGWMLPQIFWAKVVESLPCKTRALRFWAFLQRAGWVLFLGSLFVNWSPTFTLTFFFIAIALQSFSAGFSIPIWTDWYAKTTSPSVWGRVLGLRRAFSGLLGIPVGYFVVRPILNYFGSPMRYGWLAGITLLLYGLSYGCIWMIKEAPSEVLPEQKDARWGDYFRGLGRILFLRRDYRAFIIASLLACTPLVLMKSFLTPYGLTHPGVDPGVSGTFTMFYSAAIAVGGFASGILSDRRGPLVPFRVFPLIFLAAVGTAVIAPHPWLVSAAWGLVGIAFGMRMAGMLPALFAFAEAERRPSYMAISFTVLNAANSLIPPLAGALLDAQAIDFRQLFLFCGALSLAGWLMLMRIEVARQPGPPDRPV